MQCQSILDGLNIILTSFFCNVAFNLQVSSIKQSLPTLCKNKKQTRPCLSFDNNNSFSPYIVVVPEPVMVFFSWLVLVERKVILLDQQVINEGNVRKCYFDIKGSQGRRRDRHQRDTFELMMDPRQLKKINVRTAAGYFPDGFRQFRIYLAQALAQLGGHTHSFNGALFINTWFKRGAIEKKESIFYKYNRLIIATTFSSTNHMENETKAQSNNKKGQDQSRMLKIRGEV